MKSALRRHLHNVGALAVASGYLHNVEFLIGQHLLPRGVKALYAKLLLQLGQKLRLVVSTCNQLHAGLLLPQAQLAPHMVVRHAGHSNTIGPQLKAIPFLTRVLYYFPCARTLFLHALTPKTFDLLAHPLNGFMHLSYNRLECLALYRLQRPEFWHGLLWV